MSPTTCIQLQLGHSSTGVPGRAQTPDAGLELSGGTFVSPAAANRDQPERDDVPCLVVEHRCRILGKGHIMDPRNLITLFNRCIRHGPVERSATQSVVFPRPRNQ
jgi:hypothetical protein